MSDLRVLPLRRRDLPRRPRLRAKARVYRVPGYGWVWQHDCDHDTVKVSPIGFRSQAVAFGRAWSHVRRCW
jgi:hypothetical protein